MRRFFLVLLIFVALIQTQEQQQYDHQIKKRIIKGFDIDPKLVKYHTVLFLYPTQKSRDKQVCGGNLISVNYVLTVAHCLIRAKYRLKVLLGGYYGDDATQIFDKCHYKVHDNYTHDIIHDIGLVLLSRPARLGSTVEPVPLPNRNQRQDYYNLQTGTICGRGQFGDGTIGRRFMCTNVTVSITECLKRRIVVPVTVLCVSGWGYGTGQAAKGDSGGGLVIGGVLVALISHCLKAHKPFGPFFYTKISPFLDWIQANSDLRM